MEFKSSGSVTQLPYPSSPQASAELEFELSEEYSNVARQCEEEEEFINEYLRPVTVTVSDGNAFKTVLGGQPMTPGGRYFFEVRVNAGQLMKIGICRKTFGNVEKVSVVLMGAVF